MIVMEILIAVLLGIAVSWVINHLAMRWTPKFPVGTHVRWRYDNDAGDEWNTGTYVRHRAVGWHGVRVTGPAWWTSGLGREVPVRSKELQEDT